MSLDSQVAKIRAEGGDVFVLRAIDFAEAWKVRLEGEVLAPEWPSRGAAVAGYIVEKGRREVRRHREWHGWSFRGYSEAQCLAIRHYIATGQKGPNLPG